MDIILGQIKDIMSINKHAICYPKMENIIIKRHTIMNYAIHCLGFALSHRFYNQLYLATLHLDGLLEKLQIVTKRLSKGL